MAKSAKKKTPTASNDPFKALKDDIEKKHGDGSAMYGSGDIVKIDSFPTRVASIDRALGIGGLPQGRIIEIFGWESSGKTTTCLQFIAACQKHYFEGKDRHGTVAFVDAEHALDTAWAKKCGVNVDKMLISQPDSGEEALDIVEMIVKSGKCDLVIIDSVAALIPQSELDGELKDSSIGAQARLLSKAMRRLKGDANKSKTTVIFINQLRHKVGVVYGNPETTPGGFALKFYTSVRMQINKGSAVKSGEVTIAFRPTLKVIKNKVASPFTSAEYDICVGTKEHPIFGVDEVSSLIELGTELGLITRSGSFYAFGEQRLGNGIAATSLAIRNSDSIEKELREKIYSKLKTNQEVVVEDLSETDDEVDPLADELLDAREGDDD